MTVVYHSEETRAAQILRSSQFFSSLTEHEVTVMIDQTERKIYKATPQGELGEAILEQGQHCDSLHIVMEGEVTVSHLIGKTQLVSRTIGPGQVFGVVEAMKGQPADANVYATGKTSSGTSLEGAQGLPGGHEVEAVEADHERGDRSVPREVADHQGAEPGGAGVVVPALREGESEAKLQTFPQRHDQGDQHPG